MISRISFIFSFFWAHEVPILPLTLFFESRLDWIESLWLLSLPCSALSTSPLHTATAPCSAISSGIDPQILAGGSSVGRAGPPAARVQRAGGGLQPACRRRGRATCRGVQCHNPETTGGEEDNRLSPDKFSRCRRRDRRDVRWSRHRRQG